MSQDQMLGKLISLALPKFPSPQIIKGTEGN